MRGRKPSTELEELAAGLSTVEDPFSIGELLKEGLENLVQHVDRRMRLTALDMVDQGRYLHAIKELTPHGEWERLVAERRWGWEYVHCCMKLVKVVAVFPQAIHLPPGRATSLFLRLPRSEIGQILDGLSPETLSKLTVWDLKKIHQTKKIEAAKSRRPKPKPPGKEITAPSKLSMLAARALSALNLISELEIPAVEAQEANKCATQIQAACERALYTLRDPEHKTVPWWERHPLHDDVSEQTVGEEIG
jgi:hypothetical protein